MSNRTRGGQPRPIDPAWHLSQRECWDMIARATFSRCQVVRIRRRQLTAVEGRIVIAGRRA